MINIAESLRLDEILKLLQCRFGGRKIILEQFSRDPAVPPKAEIVKSFPEYLDYFP